MARALSALRGTRDHGGSGVLLITGPAGIGKTALLREIRQQAARMNVRVAGAKCDQIEQVAPGAPIIAALRSGRDPLTTTQEYEQIARLTGEPLLLAERIAAHLESVAADGPLLIAIDDLQWADRISLFLLRTLVPRLIGLPVMWLFASRDHDSAAELAGHDPLPGEDLRLAPLTAPDLAAIARDRLGRPPDATVRKYLAASGGNPLVATQILDGFARAAGEPEAVGAEFAAAVGGRLAGLGTTAGDLVRLIAVAGRPVPLRDATALLSGLRGALRPGQENGLLRGMDGALRPGLDDGVLPGLGGDLLPGLDGGLVPDLDGDLVPGLGGDLLAGLRGGDLEAAVGEAVASGLVAASGAGLGFRHDLVAETVYATIPGQDARRIHARLAEYHLTALGEPFIAAAHARAAATTGDLPSARILISAAEALADISSDDAAELAALAFRTVRPAQPEWLDLSRRCLSVLCRSQRATETITVADQILARVDDVNLAGQVETEAARALWLSGRVNELAARIERSLSTPGRQPAVTARLQAAYALARTRVLPGEQATKEAAAAVDQARRSGDREAVALAVQAAGEAARNEGRHQPALQHFRELRSLTGVSYLAEEITALQFLDRYDHAQVLLDQARSDSANHTETLLPALSCAQMWQDFKLGRFDAADAGARELIELGHQLGISLHILDAISIRAAVALMRGDTQVAGAQLRLADKLTTADADIREPSIAVMRGWLAASRADLPRRCTPCGRWSTAPRSHAASGRCGPAGTDCCSRSAPWPGTTASSPPASTSPRRPRPATPASRASKVSPSTCADYARKTSTSSPTRYRSWPAAPARSCGPSARNRTGARCWPPVGGPRDSRNSTRPGTSTTRRAPGPSAPTCSGRCATLGRAGPNGRPRPRPRRPDGPR